ncbi:hypothetical protein PL321_01045 [Caloramator sp. mosi_1]|nr:hypothetical protein [Caloramator sp. mosi_1]WDC84436.1 hypothetical protein PL321_01045 [Caloramator sp. mosi_1]
MIKVDYKLDAFRLYNLLYDYNPQLLESSFRVKDTGIILFYVLSLNIA